MGNKLAQIRANWPKALWKKYVRNENDERAALMEFTVDEDRGWHVVEFFRRFLVHTKGRWAGRPFELADCQINDIVLPMFGWARPDGRRRFTEAHIWVPKKNFKSTMLGGFGIYGLVSDNEAGPEVYAAATDKEQASIVFGYAAQMVRASKKLRRRIKIVPSKKTMYVGNNGWFRALTGESRRNEGWNMSWTIVDEVHTFDESGRWLFETLKYGGIARDNPMMVTISTAGTDDTGFGYEQYEYAKGVSKGTEENPYAFVYIREAERNDDPSDPKVHKKANPMYGITIRPDEMVASWNAVKNRNKDAESWKQKRLNIWAHVADPWLDTEAWKKCVLPFDIDELKACRCCVGLDLGETRDLTAIAVCWVRKDVYYFWVHFFLPGADIVNKERIDRMEYRIHQENGWCTITPTQTIDNAVVRAAIVDIFETHKPEKVCFDRWAAKDLTMRLQDDDGITCEPVPMNSARLNTPSRKFDSLIAERQVREGGNPILKRQISVVTTTGDTKGNLMPSKTRDGRAGGVRHKIDGVMACVLALFGLICTPEKKLSVYERPGHSILAGVTDEEKRD